MHRSRWYVRSQNFAAQCLFLAMLEAWISNWIVPVPLALTLFVGLGVGVGSASAWSRGNLESVDDSSPIAGGSEQRDVRPTFTIKGGAP